MRKFFTLKSVLLLCLSLFTQFQLHAQVIISSNGSYVQNFNTLNSSGSITWVDNTTIPNWYSKRTGANLTCIASDGSSNTGALYSFGTGTNADRALGTVGSGTVGNFANGVLLRNTSGATITDIKVSFTLEQWRNGGNTTQQFVNFYFKKSSSAITDLQPNNNSTWTQVPALSLGSPVNTATASALDGNSNKVSATNISIPGLSLADGEYIMLKWDDIDHSGNDHGLAVDDVTINWTVPPSSNANLSALTLTDGSAVNIPLTPAFASNTFVYNTTSPVSNATTPVYLNFTKANANSFVDARINGGAYNSPLLAFALNEGSNTIDVRVVAQDGITTQVYTINVTRLAAAVPVLSASSLPGFGNICVGSSAGPSSFVLNGSDLNGTNINIAALAGFSYAETAGGPYTSTLSFAAGNSLSGKTIYVRFDPIAVQSYNGNIVVSGGGVASVPVAATGSGINTPASVTTGSSTVAGTTATLNGSITAIGCSAVTSYGFEYSTTAGFANGTGTQVTASNLSGSNYSKSVSGLTPGITYYYKAFATTGAGTAYGNQGSFTPSAVVPVVMSAQPLFRYTENFSDIGNWSNNFTSGVGANHFSSVDVTDNAGIPNATKITTSSASFSSGTSGGVQKGTGNIVFLSTGTSDNSTSVAIDFYMDFTGMNAGTISFDWATINNSFATGNNRAGSFRVYASVDGLNFTELSAADVLNFVNGVPATGTVNSLALPAIFNNSATARLRFYYHNGTGGSSGSRPKISIDNLTVTGVASTPCAAPTAGPTSLVFGTIAETSIQGSFTAASPAADEYLVIASTNSSLTSNPINGQVYNVGDNVGDGDVIAKGSVLNFTASGLDGATTYYFFIFPLNSVCTGGPLYSIANVLTGTATTVAGLPPCAAPADQATNFTAGTIGINSIQASFTAGSGNEYLVLQSTSASLSGTPVNAHVYNAGDVIGNAKVIQRSSSTSFTASGLTPATTYYYYIISLNSQGCVNGPVYNIVSPLTGSATTQPLPVCVAPTSQPINLVLNASNSSVNGSFNGVSGSGYYYLVVRSSSPTLSATPVDNNDYAIGAGLGGGVVVANGAGTSFSAGGLNASTTYYFFVFSMDKNCSGGTKYLITAPLSGNATTTNTPPNNIYFGTLHSHSDYSDGNKDHPGYTPTDDYNYALGSQHMDFLGISEHNHFSSLDNPGNELAKYHSGITEASNFTAAHPGFLALYGMEWGVISGGGHVVVYGDNMSELFGWESNVNGNVGPNYDVYVPKSVYTGPDGLFKNINDFAAKNAFATLAHPNNSDYNNLSNVTYDGDADKAITGVAVESGPATSTNTTYSNPASPMFYNWYYQKMLSKGYHLGPTIDHDNHNTTFGRTTKSRTAVIAPALTQTEIIKAVREMHFYATEDYDTKVDFTVNNRIMGTVFEDLNAPSISVTVTDPTDDYSNALIRLMYGVPGSNVLPVVIDSVFGSSLNYIDNSLPNNSTGYYYIDITKGTTRTVTSPVWYTRKCAISTEFTISACESFTWNGTVYTTSVTDTKVFTTTGGCDSTVTMHLTINHNPLSAVITAPAGTTGCPGTGVALTANVNDGGNGAINSYEWSVDGNLVSGANTGNLTALQSGVYTLKAINTGGCAVGSNALTITVADNTNPVVLTQNLTVFLDASGNANITAAQIDNGSTDNCGIDTRTLSKTSFNCSNMGTQTVTLTVKDAAGNMATGTATVTVVDNLKPTVVTQNITVTLGAGGTVTILPSQVNNGSSDNCGIATMVLDKTSFGCANIGANTVKLTVTDVNGNSDFQTATVTVVGTTYVTNTTTLKNFCTIQSAISDATTLAGHTLEVQPGTYNEQVLVNKGVTIKGVGATQPVVNFTGTVTGKKTVFDVSVANVTIDNINIRVDLVKLSSGVIASGSSISNLAIKNSKIDAYASSSAASVGSYSDRNAVSVNYSGATNFRVAGAGGVSNIAFLNNKVTGMANDGFGIPRYFRSGISADDASGNFNNNTLQSINHDVIVRFGNTGSVDINNNVFNGGGVELTDFNSGATALTISGNQFNAAFANTAAANTAVLRLKNNFNSRNTIVSGNTFTDAEWGLSLENYNTVTVSGNSFTPLAGSVGYHHVTVNTKLINTNSATVAQKPISAALNGNTFNGSGTLGGTALTFLNHDNDAASYGPFVIGSVGNENSFSAGIKTFVALDAQSGLSGTATFPNYPSVIGTGAGSVTTMAPWPTALFLVNNKFDAGAGLKLPSAMSNAELFVVEDKIQHQVDAAPLGFVTVKVGNDYVTTNSWLAPLNTAASIQRGVDAASNGFTVNVGPGVFTNNVTVNKSVLVQGAGEANTIVIPAVSNPNCGGAGGGSICAGGSNVFLVQANNVQVAQLTIDGNNPSISSGTVVDGVDIDARNGIITDHTTGVYNGFTVNHVTVKNIFLRGIYASSGGSFQFNNNTVTNVQGNSSSIGIFNYGGAGQFLNNTVSNTSDAIASNWSKGSVYNGNTVTNSGSGIHTDNNGGSGGTADVIQGNTVTNSKPNGYGIWVFAPYVPSLVRGNTVSNVDVGLAAAGQQAAVTPVFERNTVDGQNKANSTGVYVTTDLFGFGTSDVSVVFQNNFIRNNADGFYLESEAGRTLNLQAHSNSITGNTNSSVTQGTGAAGAGNFIAGMECNWWGTTTTASIASGINGAAVVFNPRLVDGTDTDPAGAGFQPAPVCADPISNAIVTSQVDVNCYGSATGAVTIEFSNGKPGFNYSLDGAAPVSIAGSPFGITGLAAGAHTVTITDSDGNNTAVTFTILQPAAPISVNYAFTPIACNGGTSTQSLAIFGGTAPYSVVNQHGDVFVTGALEGIVYGASTTAADYAYRVTDAKGCEFVFTAHIPEPAALVVTASATDILCTGGSSTITVNAVGGTAPYNGTGSFNVAAGTYTYTVTDANGCTASATVTASVITDITVPTITAPANITVNSDAGICTASGVVLGTPVTADNCGVASVTNNAPAVFPVGTTTVTWTVTDNSGNTAQAVQTVTVHDVEKPVIIAPGAWSVPNDPGQCGATISDLGTPSTSDNCGVASFSNDHPSHFFPVGMTTVVWFVTDVNGNISDTVHQKVFVMDNELPTITVANITVNNDFNSCAATVSLGLPDVGDNCGVATVTNDHPSGSFPVGTTLVTWTVTDTHGWTKKAVQSVTVLDVDKPVITNVFNPVFCQNASGNYSFPGITTNDNCGIASVSYNITGATTRGGTGSNASGAFNVGISTITWTVTDLNNNTSTATATVNVQSALNAPIGVDASRCGPGSVTLSASAGAGETIDWFSAPSGGGLIASNTNTVNVSLSGASLTLYAQARNTTTGCVSLNRTAVTGIFKAIPPPVNYTTSLQCGFTTITANNPIGTLVWSPNGETTPGITVTTPGTYSAVQTVNGCTSQPSPINVAVRAVPGEVTATVSNDCGSSTISAVATMGGQLQWSTGPLDNGKTSITVTGSGPISVREVLNGCPGPIKTVTVNPRPVPAVPVILVTNNCGNTVLSTTAAGNLSWSTGDISSSITVTAAGTYSVTVTNASLCSASASATVTVNTNPVVTPISGASTVVSGSSTLFSNTTPGGTWSSNNNAIASVNASGSVTGGTVGSTTINYTVTSAAGCSTVVSAPITVTPNCTAPVLTASNVIAATAANATTCSSAVTYTVGSSGTNPITTSYVLSGATTGSGTGTGSGVVFNVGLTTVKVTATNACGSNSVTFTVNLKDGTAPVPVVSVLPTITGQCSVSLAASSNGCDDDCRCCRYGCHCRTSSCSCRDTDYRYRNFFINLFSYLYNYYYGDDDDHGCDQDGNSAPKATDNCKGTIVGTTTDPLVYNTQGTFIIHWKYDDGNGNITIQEQTVIVKDDIKPVISCPGNITVKCGAPTTPSACGSATATDNCGGVSISYTDVTNAAGTQILRTWKATDGAGNYSTCVQTITIGAAFSVDITSVPTSNVYTGGIATNLYLGYGAQSTTLQTCALPAAGAPYTYSWAGNAANRLNSTSTAAPVFTPNTYGSFTFTVTATNKHGCTSTDYITICVTDVRVPGTNGNKVYVCHQTNSKTKTSQTIQVSINAVATHLGNGSSNGCGNKDNDDRLGSCDQTPCGYTAVNSVVSAGTQTQTVTPEGGVLANNQKSTTVADAEIKVTVLPNPSTTYFTLKFESRSNAPMNLRVLDGNGRVVDARSAIVPNTSLQIGHNYSSGTYYAEVLQGGQRKVVQLIKGRG